MALPNECQTPRVRYVGYLPILFLGVCGGARAAIAGSIGAVEWSGGLVGAVIGYFGSRAILRTVYEGDLDGN
ncbi:MAG: hypothetical protein QOD39_1361 [Mycobacterium sp.]|jgi:hypothetical protein|nr:hypothetical protein [Mycobacterium sp.]